MDMKKFFDTARPLFGGKLSTQQVQGMEAVLKAANKWRLSDPHHVANVLADVWHETGGYMLPIKETVYATHKDKNPSDAVVIARLNKAWKAGQLEWVDKPYWNDGWFGRGGVQITHKDNYEKLGKAIGVDLVADRNKALDPDISADIAVVGMRDGLFTGKKLSDYKFPDALTAVPDKNPRRIINGKDGTDSKVAKAHRVFYDALVKAGYSLAPATVPDPTQQTPTPTPQRTRSVIIAEIEALLAELKSQGG